MIQAVFWALVGMALVVMGLFAVIVHAHLLRSPTGRSTLGDHLDDSLP